MSIKNDIREQIKSAIRHYDFEEAISETMDEIDLEELITQKITQRIRDVDIEPLVTGLVADLIDEQLDDIDIEGTVKYFSQKHLCQNEVQRRKVRRGGCQAPLICPVAYSGGAVKGAASAAFIGVTGYGHADP